MFIFITKRSAARATLPLLLVATLAACGDDDASPSPDPTPDTGVGDTTSDTAPTPDADPTDTETPGPDSSGPDVTLPDVADPDGGDTNVPDEDVTLPDTDAPDTATDTTTDDTGADTTDTTEPGDVEDDTTEPAPDPLLEEPLADGACRTRYEADQDGTFAPLCDLGAPVRHVRIDRFAVAPAHAASQIILGGDTAPAGATGTLAEGQLRLMAYGFTPTLLYPDLGPDSDVEGIDTGRPFTTPRTVCFDLLPGVEGGSSTLTLWIDSDTVDCRDASTLTPATATFQTTTWGELPARVDADGGVWFYQAAGLATRPVVTLFDTPMGACEVPWTETTDWQPLCTPAAGLGHLRLHGVAGEGTNRYLYAVIGEPTGEPEGNPSAPAESRTLIWHSGLTNTGASTNWTSFDGQNTGRDVVRDSFVNADGDALYAEVAATICAEFWQVGAETETPTVRFRMWATDVNGADCEDPASLTPATEAATITFNGRLRLDGWNWIKTNNTALGIERAVVLPTGGPNARD